MFRQHAVHDVLVNVDPEGLRDDARNPWTPEPRIARLELDDGLDERLARPLGARFLWSRARGKQAAVLATHQRLMKRQERRRSHSDGDLADPSGTQKKRRESAQEPIAHSKVRRTLWVSNSLSGCRWQLNQVPAVRYRPYVVEVRTGYRVSAHDG